MNEYYKLLGVSPSEILDRIQQVFRQLAMKYHPDHAGAEGTAHFQDLLQAYQVLSNPEERRRYDASQADHVATGIPVEIRPGRSRDRSRQSSRPFAETVKRRPAFVEEFRPASRRSLSVVDYQVMLSAHEASRGPVVRLRLPMLERCCSCRGQGCGRCLLDGFISRSKEVSLQLPAGLHDGQRLDYVVAEQVLLRLRIRVMTVESYFHRGRF